MPDARSGACQAAHPMDPVPLQPSWLTPQHVREGRYVLGPLLGKGGMGEVVEAWDVVLCRTVALKRLSRIDPMAMVRFMAEAQMQARIVHPNICRVYDVESSETTLRIAMQLVRGPNLNQAAKDLAPPEAVAIIAQVAEAVNVAHLMKLIHRDIKPSNILLDRGPDGRVTPCLCDFGLAWSLAEPALNITQGLAGTPAYMAPEQIWGDRKQIGPAADIYALGGTLHYALMGHPPSHRPTRSDQDRKSGLPRDLQLIIRKCLELDPGDRYPSAGALAEDLRRFLHGDPILAQLMGPMGSLGRMLRWIRGHGRTPAMGAAAALVLAGAGTLLLRGKAREREAGAEALRRYDAAETEWERDLAYFHALPGHDMRPINGQARERGTRILAELATLGRAFQGPGHAAVGRIDLQLGEFAQAARELDTARRLGARDATGQTLAQVLADWGEGGSQTSVPPAAAIRGLDPGPDPLADALAAFAGRHFWRAAMAAGSYHRSHPWNRDAVLLEAACLGALAGELLETGAPNEAEAQLQAALLTLEAFLGPEGGGASDPVAHHAYFLTARRLAELQLGAGTLSAAFLKQLQARCDQAGLLDPGDPRLQEDWLDLHVLAARRLGDLGMDRFPELDPAMVCVGTRVREPFTPGLLAARMALYWQLAEQQLTLGQDASFALAEALRDGERPPPTRIALVGEVLDCKARMEAALGQDPRPTLERAVRLLEPRLLGGQCWPVNSTAAEVWMLQAEWEQGHGLEYRVSLAKASEQIEWSLRACPVDPRANALQGLGWVVQMRADPTCKPGFLPRAQVRLGQSRGRLAQHLRQSIEALR